MDAVSVSDRAMILAETPETKTKDLLKNTQFANMPFNLTELKGGGNNLLSKIKFHDISLVLKVYDSTGNKERLPSEWKFLSLLSKVEQNFSTPRPIVMNLDENLAIYSFVQGKKLSPSTLKATHIEQAASFLKNLNSMDFRSRAEQLPNASDAGFSLSEHINILDARLAKLSKFSISNRLKDQIFQCREKLDNRLNFIYYHFPFQLTKRQQVVSPSDFGFHNALVNSKNFVSFIDFEYAGWDDPAKTVADFFFQPQIEVPSEYLSLLCDACFGFYPENDRQMHISRSMSMRPIFGLKWCCIILAPFDTLYQEKISTKSSNDLINIQRNRINSAEKMIKVTIKLLNEDP